MDKINTFTSTGIKIIHHPEVIEKLQSLQATPVTLQIAPTSRCNLNCVFCSNVNRGTGEDLDVSAVQDLILNIYNYGLKSVEWTGGGDPTMWHSINEMIEWLNNWSHLSYLEIKQGMITNGVAVTEKISQKNLDMLTWLRISMNCLDYVPTINIPEIKGTLGFSYVVNDKTTEDVWERLDKYVCLYRPSYVRIVPNCQATDEQQVENNRMLGEMVEKKGKPYFYQAKVFQKPDECYWCYLKPFLLHDGWVYPCSSVVLNYDAERKFHEKYRWEKMEDLPLIYAKKVRPFPTEHCNHCVFFNQNELIRSIIHPSGMEDFI